jgi:hypothetical protein
MDSTEHIVPLLQQSVWSGHKKHSFVVAYSHYSTTDVAYLLISVVAWQQVYMPHATHNKF